MDPKDLKIKCKDGEIMISFEITDFSQFMKEQYEKTKQEVLDFKDIEKQSFEFLIKFCDAHKWSTDTIKFKGPSEWTSHLLREQIDQYSWSVFKQLLGSELVDTPQKLEVYIKKLQPILELAYILKFPQFYKICNIAFQIPSYYDNKSTNDNYSKDYQAKWNIPYDIQEAEQQKKIIDEYGYCFKQWQNQWKIEFQQILKDQ